MRRHSLLALIVIFICSASAFAEIVTRDITYTHNGTELKGFLAYDDDKQGKLAGVLVVHEWWGLNDYPKARAKQLAEMGYVAFAPDMFGQPAVTTAAEAQKLAMPLVQDRSAMRERALAGLKVLQEQPNVDAGRLAAIGYCFGGTACLELARAGAPLKSIVSFHGNLSNPWSPPAARTRWSRRSSAWPSANPWKRRASITCCWSTRGPGTPSPTPRPTRRASTVSGTTPTPTAAPGST